MMMFSRRQLFRAVGVAAVGAPLSALAQGRCMTTFDSPACNTSEIPPIFAPTGWKTTALDHLTFAVADYQKEAAFYIALMGWTLRSDDGTQAVLDIGDWGSAIFKSGGDGVRVESFSWVIDRWNATAVESDLRKRGLSPTAENGANGFESFWVNDPDGWPVRICNGSGLARGRRSTPAAAKSTTALPFASTGWKTVWLDHLSFNVTNYKQSVSFYTNLLG